MKQEYWMNKHFSYIFNRECEYFPCHPGADPENFNCLFCYCPLYALGDSCGGVFTILPNGYKDCSLCMFPPPEGELRQNRRPVPGYPGADVLFRRKRQNILTGL